ncbi:MAG: hypothetical protein ACO3EZ_00505, partial [Prochlorotrichaceae cyanobacterium]
MLTSSLLLFFSIALLSSVFWLWQRQQSQIGLDLQRLGKEKQLLQNLFPAMVQASSVETALRIVLEQVC